MATKKKTKTLKEFLSNTKEIAQGVTLELLSPLYFDINKLLHQPEPIYRLDSKDHRFYYRYVDEEPVFYTSVTTMIRNTLPTPPSLITWIADKGQEAGHAEAMERASYGTFLHGQCADLLITQGYDLDKLPDKLKAYSEKERIPFKPEWIEDLQKDIMAFAQFVYDYKVLPLAIEIILYHPTDGYAGAIDLVCEMDYEEKGFYGETYLSGANKGQPKESKQTIRINAIIDLKSGRKGFYESHEIQLEAYWQMWKQHFPDVSIYKVFNWSPKDWRTTPSYNLKDQTGSKNLKKLPHLVELSKIEADKRNNTVTEISGTIDLKKGTNGKVSEITFSELVKKHK